MNQFEEVSSPSHQMSLAGWARTPEVGEGVHVSEVICLVAGARGWFRKSDKHD